MITNDNLPQDPFILLSYINTRLRDNYSSFKELCDDMNIDATTVTNKLLTIGYCYNPNLNQFE